MDTFLGGIQRTSLEDLVSKGIHKKRGKTNQVPDL